MIHRYLTTITIALSGAITFASSVIGIALWHKIHQNSLKSGGLGYEQVELIMLTVPLIAVTFFGLATLRLYLGRASASHS